MCVLSLKARLHFCLFFCQKQTTKTDFVPNKPVVTPMPPVPMPPPPAPARLPTPPLPPPAAEPTRPAADAVVSRQNSTASSENGSVTMREHHNQRPAPVNRESLHDSTLFGLDPHRTNWLWLSLDNRPIITCYYYHQQSFTALFSPHSICLFVSSLS